MPTQDPTHGKETTKRRRVVLLVSLLALAAFMYFSIMYKIINYGP